MAVPDPVTETDLDLDEDRQASNIYSDYSGSLAIILEIFMAGYSDAAKNLKI